MRSNEVVLIISHADNDKKKQILKEFPDEYINHLTTIKTPTGEVLDALIWDTDEIIYLVKIVKPKVKVNFIYVKSSDPLTIQTEQIC